MTAGQVAPEVAANPSTAAVRNLSVTFPTGTAGLPTLHGIDLELRSGTVTAVVGESGAGKSVTVAALLGLLPRSAEISGRLRLAAGHGHEALDIDLADRDTLARRVRGRRIALVPQSAATWLTPVRTIVSQLAEAAAVVGDTSRGRDAAARARFPWDLGERYPHELSGGQLQRAALALALVGQAPVLLADEPTSGLDPDLAHEAMTQLADEAARGAAVLLVTHDLLAAEAIADTIVVLYAGHVVEQAPAADYFAGPAHPYGAGLLASLPDRGFEPVPGDPPAPGGHSTGCVFGPRCGRRSPACDVVPVLAPVRGTDPWEAACYHPIRPAGTA